MDTLPEDLVKLICKYQHNYYINKMNKEYHIKYKWMPWNSLVRCNHTNQRVELNYRTYSFGKWQCNVCNNCTNKCRLRCDQIIHFSQTEMNKKYVEKLSKNY